MIKTKKVHCKSSSKINTVSLQCFNSKQPITKRKSKSKTKTKTKTTTTTSSSCISRKSLHLNPIIKQSWNLSHKKSKEKNPMIKQQLLRWCTQSQLKLRVIDTNNMNTYQTTQKQKHSHCITHHTNPSFAIKKQLKYSTITSLILYQIVYQKQLRQLKHLINESNFQFLLQQMRFYNIKEQQLELLLDEYDTFVNLNDDVDNLRQELLKCISDCNKHWNTNIKKKFSKQQVMNLFEEIDKDMNGLIDLKSMTTQLGNLVCKKFHKRDIIRVFKRLSSGYFISLSSLMRELCSQYNY